MQASKILKEREPIPHEPDAWLTLKGLGGTKLREAAEQQTRRQITIFGVEGLKAIQTIKREDVEDAERTLKADPLNNYDIDTLIRAGIVGGSYWPGKPRVEDIDGLDERTQRWAATELLKMSKPELFEDAEADAKNS